MKAKLTLIAAAMAVSGFAFAQGAGTDSTEGAAGATDSGVTGGTMEQTQAGLLSVIDKDADGKVTQDELMSYFQQHDANGDGSLDQSEFAAFENPPAGEAPMQQDQISPDSGGTMQQSPSDTQSAPGPTSQ